VGEHADLWRAASELRAQAEGLRGAAEAAEEAAAKIERVMHGKGVAALGGEELIEKLAELVDEIDPDGIYHYNELLDILTAAAYTPTGKDPRGTLLAALSRTDRFTRTGRKRSGLYRRRGE
jgi:hypothetical protein